jgi:preprotein translocase subunit SecF
MAKLSGLGGRLYSGETSFNIVENRKRWYSVSAIFIIVSFFALFVQGLHLGIEFKGGASFTVNKPTATVQQAREAVEAVGLPGEIIVQKIGDSKVRVQTGAVDAAQSRAIETALTQKFNVTEESIDTQLVGPSWGKEITKKAIYGLIAFLLVIMLFLAMVFEPKMAAAAILAVVHDVFITVGIYALVGFDVTPATIIGFLTILGYSLYDTVVVFDKVRENTLDVEFSETTTFASQVNLAINQTLVRSVNTSVVAVLPVAAILFVGATALGAGTLRDISLALFIGIIFGTYSSVFLAGPLYVDLRSREGRFKDKTASAKI